MSAFVDVVQSAVSERDDLQGKLESVKKELAQYRGALKNMRAKLDELRENGEVTNEAFTAIMKIKKEIKEKKGKIKKKEGKIEKKEGEIEKKEEEIEKKKEEIEKKKEEIEEKKGKIKKKEGKIEEKEGEIEEEKEEIKKIEGQIEKIEGQIEKIEGQIEKIEGQIEKIEGQIEKIEGEIKEEKEAIDNDKDGKLLKDLLSIDHLDNCVEELVQEKKALLNKLSNAPAVAPLQTYRRGVNPFVHPDVVNSRRFLKGKLNARQYDVVGVTLDVMTTDLPLSEEVADNLIPTSSMFAKCNGELGMCKHVYGGILGLMMVRSVEAPLSIQTEILTKIAFGVDNVASLNTVRLVPDWAISYGTILTFVGEAKRAQGEADMGKALMLVSEVLCNMHDAKATSEATPEATLEATRRSRRLAAAASSANAEAAEATPSADAAALKAFGVHVGGPNLTVIRASFKDATKSGSELSKRDNIEYVKTVFDMKNKESAKDACKLLKRIYTHVQEFWSTRRPGSSQIPTDAIEFTATSMKPDLGGQNSTREKDMRSQNSTPGGDKRNGNGKRTTGPNAETTDGVHTMCEANDAALYARGVVVDLGVRHLVCDDVQPADALADMNAHRRLRTGTWRDTRVFIKELVHEECGGEPHELTVLKRLRGTRGVIGVCATVRLPYLHRTALLTPLHCVLARHWRLEKADAGTWEWLAALFDQAAAALLAALARGVAHGDVKPANMVVTARDELLLIDFDVAMIGEPGGPLLTTSRAGTRGYLAPEKCAAAHMHDAVAADVFSLGASFRKLLAAMPGGKRTKTRQRLDEMLARMVAEAPGDRPTLAEVREWRQPRKSSPTQSARSNPHAAAAAKPAGWRRQGMVKEKPKEKWGGRALVAPIQ